MTDRKINRFLLTRYFKYRRIFFYINQAIMYNLQKKSICSLLVNATHFHIFHKLRKIFHSEFFSYTCSKLTPYLQLNVSKFDIHESLSVHSGYITLCLPENELLIDLSDATISPRILPILEALQVSKGFSEDLVGKLFKFTINKKSLLASGV